MFATKVYAMHGAIHIWKRNHVHVLGRAHVRSITEPIHTFSSAYFFLSVALVALEVMEPTGYDANRPYCPYPGYYPPYTTATTNMRLGTVATNRFTHRQWRKMADWTLNRAQREGYRMFTMYNLSKTQRKRVNMSLDNGMVSGKLFRVLMS